MVMGLLAYSIFELQFLEVRAFEITSILETVMYMQF